MKSEIMIFDAGKYVCLIKTESHFKDGSVMEILNVTLPDGKNVELLHVQDMEYGIIIPDNVGQHIRNIVDGGDLV